MAQFTFSDFIPGNKAPRDAKHIGVYNSQGERVGEIPLGTLQASHTGTPIYRFGLLSDVHTDDSDYSYTQTGSYNYNGDEGAGDLRRALTWLRDVEQVNLVCCCGDLSQAGLDSEYVYSRDVIAEVIPNIPFYTCTGNHDTSGHTSAATFSNYFNTRTIDTNSYSINISTAYNNSFYFVKSYTYNSQTKNDLFIFLSQYQYSNSTAGQYLAADMDWVESVISAHTNDRIFLFNHLFFIEYAGNLGRVNGTGGIYPSNNVMNGTTKTRMDSMLATYPNVYWFSGHSHWKWSTQHYQTNAKVQRYGTNGGWTINVPSCSLPIDSDYSSLNGESGNNRVRKPLESQGAVVDVYPDSIVLRGIDFNINTSELGDTTKGYTGDTYVRYLPIANYDLSLG